MSNVVYSRRSKMWLPKNIYKYSGIQLADHFLNSITVRPCVINLREK